MVHALDRGTSVTESFEMGCTWSYQGAGIVLSVQTTGEAAFDFRQGREIFLIPTASRLTLGAQSASCPVDTGISVSRGNPTEA
jgi:hypothetical protein